jgi:hypothetical protein
LPAVLHIGDFADRRGERFQLDAGGDRVVEAILVDVTEDRRGGEGTEQFSLIFRASPGAPIEQRIYAVTHPELGRSELFLVPVGRDAAGVEYQAVFNRLVAAGGTA